MGYIGQRMSERAAAAYASGERPLSRWGKADLLKEIGESYGEGAAEKASSMPLPLLKERFLSRSSWHHTGKMFRRTDFYAVDRSMGPEELERALAPAAPQRIAQAEAAETWALVSYEKWERVAVNRFGRLAWRKSEVRAVARWIEKGGKAGIAECAIAPGEAPARKEVSSLCVIRKLPGKPRKNARVWKECGEEEAR